MRFSRLSLERFRHFRDASLTLADGSSSRGGLSVVYGPNEAGKTTVLEAIRCFLFGFRDKSADLTMDYEQSELKVSALLRLDNGKELLATRTKGRKQTLIGSALQGGEEFDDEWLMARLSRPSRAVFENVFGFSLEMLARGAESLKEHEVRTAIYGAGFGGNVDLQRVLADFAREKETLFKEGGKLPRINQLARTLDEGRRAVRQAVTPTEEHRRAREDLSQKREMAQAKDAAEAEHRTEIERLRSVLLAIEPFVEMKAAEEELASLTRPAGFSAESGRAYEKAAVERDRTREELAALDEKTREAEARLAELTDDAEVEGAGDDIDALMEGLGAFKTMRLDAPKLKSEGEALGRRTEEKLAKLMPSWDLNTLLAADLEGPMRADLAAALAELEALKTEEERLSSRRGELRALTVQRDARRRKLNPPLRADGPDPGGMVVPPPEEIACYEAEYAEYDRKRAAAATRAEDLAKRLQANDEQRSAIDAGGQAPSEEDLTSARARRDEGFRILEQAATLGLTHVEYYAKRYAAEGEPLPRAYERALRVADDVADQMRRRADEVQRRAILLAERARLTAERAALDAAREKDAEEHAVTERRYAALFAEAGIEPLGPAAMRRWLEERLLYVEADQRLQEEDARCTEIAERLVEERSRWDGRWQALVRAAGLPSDITPNKARRTVEELYEIQSTFVARRRELTEASARMEEASGDYQQRVAAMLARCGGAGSGDAARDMERLFARLKTARQAARTRDELGRAMRSDERRAAAVRERMREAERTLSELRAAAGATDDEGVRRVAALSARADELTRAVAEHRQTLRRAGLRWGYDAWLAEVEHAAPENIERRIAELTVEADTIRRQAREIDQDVGRLAEGLTRLDGGSRAADEQAALEGTRAALAEEVERYAVVAFAEEIMRASIRRFEREHQSELIASASSLFQKMTRGRYERVERRLDGSLFAIRQNGRALSPDTLSTGTREQLFIALRLAYVEHYQKGAESLPLVLDDVLVNFDEERTRGTIEALDAFSQKTQVLLFTCHRSLVRLVKEVNPGAHIADVPA
jgi:uncharacterized protein YhaN